MMDCEEKRDWIEKRFIEMSNLKDGWVFGGRAIKERAISFSKAFFDCIDSTEHYADHYACWDLGPYPNGSIIITYKNGDTDAAINVAETGISAFVANDKTKLYETITLRFEDCKVLDELLKFINTYLY